MIYADNFKRCHIMVASKLHEAHNRSRRILNNAPGTLYWTTVNKRKYNL